jgi:hypothetical protein
LGRKGLQVPHLQSQVRQDLLGLKEQQDQRELQEPHLQFPALLVYKGRLALKARKEQQDLLVLHLPSQVLQEQRDRLGLQDLQGRLEQLDLLGQLDLLARLHP